MTNCDYELKAATLTRMNHARAAIIVIGANAALLAGLIWVGGCVHHHHDGYEQVEVVDVHGYHHRGYYDERHDWHGGYYDERNAFHDDPHDWDRDRDRR